MSRMGVAAGAVTGLVLGAVAGAAAFWALTGPLSQQERRLGSWSTVEGVGQAHQSPYARARVALYGIWGLPPSEVVYFTGDQDAAGEPLRGACTYAVRGGPLPTRFWSVTLYRNGFFIPNPANRYSWSSTDAAIDPSGGWTVTLAPSGEGPGHLTFGPDKGLFQVSLRLYQPAPGVAEHRDRVALPRIERLGCKAFAPPARS